MNDEPEVICQRTFLTVLDGVETPVTARWASPRPHGREFACRYSISIGDVVISENDIYGYDTLQALLLAMEMVAVVLYVRQPPVCWTEPDDDLGLPVSDIISEPRAKLVRRSEGPA